MLGAYQQDDTITAIATPNGVSAIGIIRLSGPEAFTICNKVFKGKNITLQASHTVHYGFIMNGDTAIDEVMVTLFRAPKSFTTEDSIEIACHGSPYILEQIINVLITAGARLALPGEFTIRAFMKGRIDLSQAEAVADLIVSQNASQHAIAMQQMRGGITNEIALLRQELLDFVSLIELELDFGEEDVEFADRKDLYTLVNKIIHHISPLINSFRYGNAIKNGLPIAIIGRPNAGKSSLLNLLLQDERAIVSDIAGTTRDTIEEVMTIGGVPFRFIDTAGIRATEDTIEKIGIAKALKKIEEARMVLYIFDAANTPISEVLEDISMINEKNHDISLLIMVNKTDLLSNDQVKDLIATIKTHGHTNVFAIQANNNSQDSLNQITKALDNIAQQMNPEDNQTVITNVRHYNALLEARNALNHVVTGLDNRLSSDLLSLDIKQSLNALGQITGEVTSDEILGNIFGKFCIGK
ncbi:MAG: tRNA uridine-5-carboxymethylaminomethyl(34) synthesis GTPase MnmE [Bacteroidota bacterium]